MMESTWSTSFEEVIGKTPLIRIPSLSKATGCEILVKCEWMNPIGSIKDRIALGMISAAEKDGKLKPGDYIYEATAGNTGLGLLAIANARGYKCVFYAPEKVSVEKIDQMRMLGAEVVICPNVGADNPEHFRQKCRSDALKNGALAINQFQNPANWQAHYASTGPEIYKQTGGKIDAFIVNSGTGGTLGGVTKYLKEQNVNIETYYIDINTSGVKVDKESKKMRKKTESEMKPNSSSFLEGIGGGISLDKELEAGLQVAIVDDDILADGDLNSIRILHYVNKHDGLLLGGSTGVNLVGAFYLAKKYGPVGKIIVTIAGDHGSKYQSKLFNHTWLKEKDFEIGNIDNLDFLNA